MPNQNFLTENQKQNNSDEVLIDLSTLWQIAIELRYWIVGIIAISMLIALVFALVLPKRWEATATLQVGRIPSSDTINSESKLIEDPAQIAERIKLREFKEKVLLKMQLPIEEFNDDRTDLLLSSLKGSAIKGTDFITLTSRGYSREEATKALLETQKEVKVEHDQITKPILKRLTEERLEVINKLNIATSELKNTQAQISTAGIYKPTTAFSTAIVAINFAATKEAEVRVLNTQVIQYNSLLASFDEQSTRLVSKIFVPRQAFFPKKSIFLVMGLIFGLLLSTGLVLYRYKRMPTKE